jgi:NAD(P)-dependent dehydrogenase (short-subunit alcohol dehydrogenase family)
LATRGAEVTLADVDEAAAGEAAAELRGRGYVAAATRLDVTDSAAVDALFTHTHDARGRLDYVFNNAGIGAGGELVEQSLDAWNRIIDVNLKGVVHGVQAAYPLMAGQGFGHIVNTASMQGLVPSPLTASYSTTKHAIVGLSKALRVEARSRGVRVTVLCPGVIRTPLLSGGAHGVLLPAIPEEEQRRWMQSQFERLRPLDARVFAEKALRAVARNKAIVVIPSWWKALWWLDRVSPALSLWVAEKGYERLARELATLKRSRTTR